MIYKNGDSHGDEFTENNVFTNSFFFRTHILWNILPLQIKIIESYELFKKELEGYLWDGVVDIFVKKQYVREVQPYSKRQ